MDGNPHFPSPVPSLAPVKKAIDALDAAETEAQSLKLGTRAVRNEARRKLVSLLVRLKSYVQGVADDDSGNAASIIESAGMSIQPKDRPAKAPLAARHGRVHGLVLLAARRPRRWPITTRFRAQTRRSWSDWSDVEQLVVPAPSSALPWIDRQICLAVAHIDGHGTPSPVSRVSMS